MNINLTAAAAALAALASMTSVTAQFTHTHLSTIQSANQAGEICAFDAASGRYFVTNPDANALDVYIAPGGALQFVTQIALAGAPNSVTTYNGLVAVCVEGATPQAPGQVQFFTAATAAANGPSVTVGALPDMLTFTPNGAKLVVANEGEADLATGLINPEGTVSIVDVATRTAQTASFAPFNGQKAALQAQGVRLSNVNGVTLAQDVEPEFVAVDPTGTTAYVTLQENNAIAEVDIASATVTAIRPLGEKDYNLPGNSFDPSNQDGIDGNFLNRPILGLFMPDAVTAFTVGGTTYLATANEGDSRGDFPGFEDETRGNGLEADFALDTEDATPETGLYSSSELNNNAVLGRLNFVTGDYDLARGDTDGDGDVDQLYAFGGRSFTIWNTDGTLVFDSGNQIEQAMLAAGLWQDGRSDDKGPEPEAVAFGEVNGVPLLFVGLERTHAVLVYDVTVPAAPLLVDTIDVSGESGIGAQAPEGLQFIPAAQSPTGKPMLAVSTEAEGGLHLFEITQLPAAVPALGTLGGALLAALLALLAARRFR